MKFYPCARADNFQRSVRIPEQIWTIWCILKFCEFRICCFQLLLLRRAFATGDRRDTDEDDVDSPKSQDFRRVFVVANLLQTAPNCHIVIFQGHFWLLFASTKLRNSISGMWLTKLPPSNVLEGLEHWKGFRGTELDKDDELPFWEESDFVEDWLNAELISSMFFSMFHVADSPKGKTCRKRTGPWLAPFRGSTDMGRRFSAGLHGQSYSCEMCHELPRSVTPYRCRGRVLPRTFESTQSWSTSPCVWFATLYCVGHFAPFGVGFTSIFGLLYPYMHITFWNKIIYT